MRKVAKHQIGSRKKLHLSKKKNKKRSVGLTVGLISTIFLIFTLIWIKYRPSLISINKINLSQPVKMAIETERKVLKVGDEINLGVVIDPGGMMVAATQVSLVYDPAKLQYIKFQSEQALPVILQDAKNENGRINFALGADSKLGLNSRSTIATLKFKVIRAEKTEINFKQDSTKIALLDSENNALGQVTGLVLDKDGVSNEADTSTPNFAKTDLKLKLSKGIGGKKLKLSWENHQQDNNFSNYTVVIIDPKGQTILREKLTQSSYQYPLPVDLVDGKYQVRVWLNYNGSQPSQFEIKNFFVTNQEITEI